MTLFFIGLVEMLIISAWTKTVTEAKVLVSGIVTVINVFIWYYVLQQVMSDIKNWQIVLAYAIGCAIGTMISTFVFKMMDNKRRSRLEEKKAAAIEN
ncbi:MAG TPA: DUF5698 domain-containing protein [Candidatus Bipolaricaulota bacterium]|nr:DUF5698 domain-containing protein [Candidatus Bipolaricaulota bacterium]